MHEKTGRRSKHKNRRAYIMGCFLIIAVVCVAALIMLIRGDKSSYQTAHEIPAANELEYSDEYISAYADDIAQVVDVPSETIIQQTASQKEESKSGVLSDGEAYTKLTITDHVQIELDKPPVSNFEQMPVFYAKYLSIPKQSLCAAFSCHDKSDGPVLIYTSGDGAKLTISATEMMYYETAAYDRYSYFLPIDDELNDMSNYFPNETDLESFSRENALMQISDILSDLGISTNSNPRIITLDQESLNRAQAALEKSMFWKNETASNRKKYARTWTKNDECYALVFEQSLEGYPIDAYFCRGVTDQTRFSSRVTALVGPNGLIGMRISGLYSITEKEAAKPVISYKDAVDSLVDYYTQNIFERDRCFVRAELKLVAVEQKKKIALKPMWVFTSTDNGASIDDIRNRTIDNHLFLTRVYVDAYSGEVIVK